MSEIKSNRLKLPYWASQVLTDKQHDRFVITGGLGCLRGDVKIRTEKGLIPISELSEPMLVQSWNDQTNQFQLSQASASFRKGRGYLFEVTTKQGKFVANGYHQMLCACGTYQRVEHLEVGSLLSCSQSHLSTNLGASLLKLRKGVQRLKKRLLGFWDHCAILSHQYDQLPLETQGICLRLSPLLSGVRKLRRISSLLFFFDVGDLVGQSQERTQGNQSCGLKYKKDYESLALALAAILASLVLTSSFERTSFAILVSLLFPLMFLLHHIAESSGLYRVLASYLSSSISKTTIVSIKQIESNDYYWDLQVLDTNNYVTEDGTIHHNSGKSTTGLMTFIIKVLNNPKVEMWWVVAPTHSRIDDSMIPAALFGLEMLGLKANIHYRLLKSKPQTLHFLKTKQQIRFVSADKPEHMVSATLGGYFVTEAFRIKREVYENLESRTRSKLVDTTLGILEGTPEGDTWGKDEFNIDKSDPARKMRRFILQTYDNEENLSPDYIPRLHQIYAHSPAMIRSYIYGEFSSFRLGDVFAQYLESRNVIPKVEADPMKPIALCFDFNATPMTWSAWQTISYKVGVRVRVREVCIAESSLDCRDLFSAALEVGKTFDPEIYQHTSFELWGDRTGHAKSHKASGTDYSNLKDYLSEVYSNVTIKAAREVTPIRASVDVANRLLLYELVLICENCKNVRRSLNMTKWAAGKDDLEKKSGETHTHHGDGLRYRLWWLYKSVNIDDILDNKKIMGINPA